MAWRYLTMQFARHQSEFGQVKRRLARNFFTIKRHAGNSNSVKENKSIDGLPAFRNVQNTKKEGLLGPAMVPIHMHMVPSKSGNLKEQLWRLIRATAVTFVLIYGVEDLTGGKGIKNALRLGTFQVEPLMESNAKFSDVKGVDDAKAELEEIVYYLRDPERFTRLGGKLPKGVLLVGEPGSGKTMLARAIAGEAGVPFFYCRGSELVEMFAAVGARRVRELFQAAKNLSPCIVFIDEIDTIGGTKIKRLDRKSMQKSLKQLLVELDNLKQNQGVVVIGATNFPSSLDKALIRRGRFDRHVFVAYPDVKGRRQIIEFYMSEVVKDDDVDVKILARQTAGFSGAELSNMVNIAALRAATDSAKAVSMAHLEYARDKITLGSERKSVSISKESKRNTAFYESGLALVAFYTDGLNLAHKITIVPHIEAFGTVTHLLEKHRISSRKDMLAKLDACMGGRAAEELIFGYDGVTSKSKRDLNRATRLARLMVTKYGMNDEVGIVTHDYIDGGRSISTETMLLIEKEIKQLLDKAYNNAKAILTSHSDELHALAGALMECETLTKSEIKALIAQVKSKQKRDNSSESKTAASATVAKAPST